MIQTFYGNANLHKILYIIFNLLDTVKQLHANKIEVAEKSNQHCATVHFVHLLY